MALNTLNSLDGGSTDPSKPRTTGEVISESLQGKDKPIERHHPVAPFAMVFWFYPLMLVFVLALGFVLTWWFVG